MTRAWLAAILILAFAVRLGWALAAPNVDPYLRQDPLFGDAKDYVVIAVHVVTGEGYSTANRMPTAYRAPGYPFFLVPFYALWGDGQEPVTVAQAVLGLS